jgi:hypothetical protein
LFHPLPKVDCRNTDNLKAMREIAVYLFAQEAGNEERHPEGFSENSPTTNSSNF